MCGRFAFFSPQEAIMEAFGLPFAPAGGPRYNISPSQAVSVIHLDDSGELVSDTCRWGLVPFWAKDPAIGNRMINARAETVAEKPSFREAFKHRRCVVLADGFYEWHRDGDVKIPHFISLLSGEPFGLAALWENWTDKESGESLSTTTLITTAANEFMQTLHHRMPVILQPESANDWLSGAGSYLEEAVDRTPALRAWPVDRQVNNARNQGEELIIPDGEITS